MSTPNEDGCCSACWLPYEMCECQHWSKRSSIGFVQTCGWCGLPEDRCRCCGGCGNSLLCCTCREDESYDNGDRSEDIEIGLVHGDGGERTYLNDNDGE